MIEIIEVFIQYQCIVNSAVHFHGIKTNQ